MNPARNVNRAQQPAAKRGVGLRILLTSLAAGAVGVTPLILYVLLGPKDGNPIGLGLLAMLAVPVAVIGAVIGVVTMAVEFFVLTKR
jgi:hypothetical protein